MLCRWTTTVLKKMYLRCRHGLSVTWVIECMFILLTRAVSGLIRLVAAVILTVAETVKRHALTGVTEEFGDTTSGRGCQAGRDQ